MEIQAENITYFLFFFFFNLTLNICNNIHKYMDDNILKVYMSAHLTRFYALMGCVWNAKDDADDDALWDHANSRRPHL